MIDLIINKVFENSTKIDTLMKQLNKKKVTQCLFIFTTIFSMSRVIKRHEKKISELETQINGIKSTLV